MDPANDATTPPNDLHEADIGSGERSPGQRDTDALIDQIGKAPPPAALASGTDQDPARQVQQKTGPV